MPLDCRPSPCGSPMPSVPTSAQRRPRPVSACAVHQAVEVLPLVPVVAMTLSCLARPAQEQVRDRADQVLQVSDGGDARIVEAEAGQVVVVDQAGGRARLQRGSDEAARVVRVTRPGQEGIARRAPGGGRCAVAPRRARPSHCAAASAWGRCEVRSACAQKLSRSAGTVLLAMICGVTSRSGGTLSRRSVCCTTWLNTGAATAPP